MSTRLPPFAEPRILVVHNATVKHVGYYGR